MQSVGGITLGEDELPDMNPELYSITYAGILGRSNLSFNSSRPSDAYLRRYT